MVIESRGCPTSSIVVFAYSIMKSSSRSESPLVYWQGIGVEFHISNFALSTAGDDERMCFAKSDDDTPRMARPAS